jgi:hypothetical protein
MAKEDKLSNEEREEVRKEIKKAAHERVLAQASIIKSEYKKQVSTAIITAFGLVIALVWKDVITALLPSTSAPGFLQKFPLLASLYAAVMITIVSVIGILLVTKWAKPKEAK